MLIVFSPYVPLLKSFQGPRPHFTLPAVCGTAINRHRKRPHAEAERNDWRFVGRVHLHGIALECSWVQRQRKECCHRYQPDQLVLSHCFWRLFSKQWPKQSLVHERLVMQLRNSLLQSLSLLWNIRTVFSEMLNNIGLTLSLTYLFLCAEFNQIHLIS